MKKFANLKSYFVLSGVAAAFVGILVYFGIRKPEAALVWALATFIVSIVIVATLDLSFKADDEDPNRPRLR